jgi:hypothetical protein
MNLLQGLEGLGVRGVHERAVDISVALGTGLFAGVTRRWAGDPEKPVAGQVRDGCGPAQVEIANRLPAPVLQLRFLIQMVVAGWTIPRHRNTVGVFLNSRHDRETGHPTGLYDGQMWNALRPARQNGQKKSDRGDNENGWPLDSQSSERVHKLQKPVHWQFLSNSVTRGRRMSSNNCAQLTGQSAEFEQLAN